MDSESSSQDQSTTECSSESSDEDEKLETAQIGGIRLQLPQGLCERKDVFQEFFSSATWNSLSEVHRQHLKTFLPTFPENDNQEKNITLNRLFRGEIFRFSNPLEQFREHLKAGHYRPDIAKMRLLIKKAERKESKFRYKLHRNRLKTEINVSKCKLLGLVRNLPPGSEPKIAKMEKDHFSAECYINPILYRTKRRYFHELTLVREKIEDNCMSSDENYPEGPPASLSRKQKRHLNGIKNSSVNNVISTYATKSNSLELERLLTPTSNPFVISEDAYKNSLAVHKRKRTEFPDEHEYCTTGITIGDVISRTDLISFKKLSSTNNSQKQADFKPILLPAGSGNVSNPVHGNKRKLKSEAPPVNVPSQTTELIRKLNPFFGHSSNSDSDSDSLTKRPLSLQAAPPLSKAKKKVLKTEKDGYQLTANSLDAKSLVEEVKPLSYGKITPATLSDLDGIDMMNLPIDLEDSNIDILELHNKPELMQETHSNFLSLVRDIICSTNEHRMSMRVLEERLKAWQENPISPLNDWYSLADNWVALLPLAVDFLSGNCLEQPDDFVPYIEYKTKIDVYQWIGAGRDLDGLLAPLCQYWLEHRTRMKITNDKEDDVEVSDRSQTPPPPRCPTTWNMRKANSEEVKNFQEQERKRYNSPHKAFTYRCNGYESVVGPVKGVYNNQNLGSTKARGHSVLSADRPNFVTILTLVRDSTARLPNGEGTRADICELLKSSQYLSVNVPDNVLQSVVSGALDRMHTQFDPCVKYEPKRKVWIYLHRNRSEEDFERIHQQYQGINRGINKKLVGKNKQQQPKLKSKNIKNTTSKADNEIVTSDDLEQQISSGVAVKTENTILTTGKSLLLERPAVESHLAKKESPSLTNVKKSVSNKQFPRQIQEKQAGDSLLAQSVALNKQVNKNVVKVMASNQGKSIIIPTTNTQLLKQRETAVFPNKHQISQQKVISQQLLQTISQQKQLLLQKQTATTGEQTNKISVPLQQQVFQTGTSPLQHIKNVTLVRNSNVMPNSPPAGLDSSSVQCKDSILVNNMVSPGQQEHISVSPAVIQQPTTVQEQVIQTKVAQPRFTPAQQQQILQTLKQKVLPLQHTIISSQYTTISKQKSLTAPLQKQPTVATSLLAQTKATSQDAVMNKPIIASTHTPLVAKVLTNAAGQVISVESLLAHQKQHGSLPQGTTLRISGTKSGQANVLQLAASTSQNPITQFSVSTQNLGVLSNQPKLVITTPMTTVATSTVTTARPATKPPIKGQTLTKFMPKITQQLVSAKFVTQNIGGQKIVHPKVIVGTQNQLKIPISSKNISKTVGLNVTGGTNAIRMVNAANINLAQLGNKPVLISSKGNTFQNIQGQNIIIQTQAGTSSQSIIISNTDKSIAHTNISHQSSASSVNLGSQQSAQVILSPPLKMQQTQQVVLGNAMKQATVGTVSLTQPSQTNQIVLGGQTVRLQTSGNSNTHRVVLASQNQGQIITQQILLPVGFQGTPLNIKALQGLKVVPIAPTQQGRGVQGRQVFARVMNPANIVRMTQTAERTNLGNSCKPSPD